MSTLPMSSLNEADHELFLRLKSDPRAIADVYDRYADRLYGFLLKRCQHREMAEDLVSKTFIKLLEAAPTLEWQGVSLGAWLFRVASNALTDQWRSSAHKKESEIDPETWDPPSDDDPAWTAEVSLEGEKIRVAMKELAPRDQQVIDMKFYGGYEIPEIAVALNVSANHASVLLYRAIGRLRQTLGKHQQTV